MMPEITKLGTTPDIHLSLTRESIDKEEELGMILRRSAAVDSWLKFPLK